MIRPSVEQILEARDDDAAPAYVAAAGRSVLEDRETFPVTDTAVEFRTHFADLTPGDLLLAGAAAANRHEVDQVALLSLVLFDHQTCMTPFVLPDGRDVASLHAHVCRWRTRPGGFVATETVTSGHIARGRTPLHL